MKIAKYPIIAFLVLIVAPLLYACASSPSSNLDIGPFIQVAENANCAEQRNQLYVIDDQFVFWTTVGSCDDASYAHILYGTTSDEKLCYLEDSFVGPRYLCDPMLEEMFQTILQNLDQPNLGLDAKHSVVQYDDLAR